MTGTLERLAPGSYDVLLDGKVMASMVRMAVGTLADTVLSGAVATVALVVFQA